MYAIKRTPQYINAVNNVELYVTIADLSTGDDSKYTDYDIVEWETKEEAQNIIDTKLTSADTYYLQYNETGPPTYDVVDLDDHSESDCLYANVIQFYMYEKINPDDLPAGCKDKLDRINVEYFSAGGYYDVYVADTVCDDGNKYRVAYCPTTTSLQINSDDLGGVDWDHQAYFKQI